MKKWIVCLMTVLSVVLMADAATISWNVEQIAATGTDQVSTEGTCLEAALMGNGDDAGVTIGGVAFDKMYWTADFTGKFYFKSASGQNLLNAAWLYDSSYQIGVNPAYADLFDDYRYAGAVDTALTLTNLVAGEEYQIQLFVADLRAFYGVSNRCVEIDGVLHDSDGLIGSQGDGSGTVLTGTFTADSASQSFTMNIYDFDDSANVTGWTLSAYQIRRLSADIVWNAAQVSTNGTSQISTNGTLLEAAYLGKSSNGLTNKTVGGVTFQPGTSTAGVEALNYMKFPVSGAYDGFYSTGNPDMAAILAGGKYGSLGDSLTLTNLVVGQQYEVQLFIADARYSHSYNTRNVGLEGHILADGVIGREGRLGCGTVVTATFTASATSYDLDMTLWNAYYDTTAGFQLNAYQVRDVNTTVPPVPATVIMLADGNSITISAGDMEDHVSVNNILQVTTNLTSGTWSNLYSVSGVTSTNWTLPTDQAQGFFRILSTN